MSDVQTAVPNPERGKAHRPVQVASCWRWGRFAPGTATACNRDVSIEHCNLTEQMPLSQNTLEDRCKICWKDTTVDGEPLLIRSALVRGSGNPHDEDLDVPISELARAQNEFVVTGRAGVVAADRARRTFDPA